MDFKMKFMDGTPVPEDYQKKVSQMVSDSFQAEEEVGIEVLDTNKGISETAQWYKDILSAQADELKPTHKGSWSTDNWIPMKAKKDVKASVSGLLWVGKGEVVLMDRDSKKVLTSDDTLLVMMIGKTFAKFFCPRNCGGVDTLLDVGCFDEVK